MTRTAWWSQAWRNIWRDARAGELRLLLVAVVLGVAGLSAVGFLSDRLNAGLQRDARQLLGGDVVVVSDQPTPVDIVAHAQASGLHGVTSLSFPTMARAGKGEGSRLVALKAVESGYPLRGHLQVATDAHDAMQVRDVNDIPAPGEVWVELGVLEALDMNLGDDLLLGNSRMRVSRLLVREPDRGVGFMNFAPRVLMNQADLAATGLVQPASRVAWRYALVGSESAVRDFSTWLESEVKKPEVRGVRIESLESGRPEMRQTLDRAGKFLNLVAMLAALLSAVAVALAARTFANRHLDDCAMLRVLGVPQRHIAFGYALEFVCIGALASLLGVGLGYALHGLFVNLLAGLINTELPPASGWPVLHGVGVGLTLLLAFGLPPVLQLAHVPALRVMRRELGDLKPVTWLVWVLGLSGFAALLLLVSRDVRLGAIVVAGFAAALMVFAALARVAVWLLRRLVREGVAPTWLMLATRQVCARPGYVMVQVSALAVGLLALFLLVLLRTDLISSWRDATPVDGPNRFVINIQPQQADAFREYLSRSGVTRYDWYPMVRGRLVAVNGQPVVSERYQDDRAKRLIDREFNLSYTQVAPSHNTLTAGQWTRDQADTLSLEDGIAKTLGLQLGDELQFDIAGMLRNARVTSLRKVDWTSMRANFFVMFPVAQLGDVPVTYIAAFRAPAVSGFDNRLVAQFPNITTVDMGATLNQVQHVLEQVVQAVEFLFVFTLLAGLVVLFAAASATRETRARDYAVLRALGASNPLLSRVQRAELLGVGALAGWLASCVALGLGWALTRYVFEFDWTAPWWVPFAGLLSGAVLAWLAGWWSLREILRRPVTQTLREASQ